MHGETKDVRLEELVPFKNSQEQTCENVWVRQLMDCIKSAGLMNPVIARPAGDGKYEVICGHNRVKALEILGCEIIHTDIRNGLSDDEATALYFNNSINQQPFSALGYPQKFETIKYYEKIIKETSRPGKRTDLKDKITVKAGGETCVQPVSKTSDKSRHHTIRDEVASQLGISTATFSKYRRIIKLPDNLLQDIAYLLDEKRITFEATYIISNMRDIDILIELMNKYPNRKLDLNILKELPKRCSKESDVIYPRSRKAVMKALIP